MSRLWYAFKSNNDWIRDYWLGNNLKPINLNQRALHTYCILFCITATFIGTVQNMKLKLSNMGRQELLCALPDYCRYNTNTFTEFKKCRVEFLSVKTENKKENCWVHRPQHSQATLVLQRILKGISNYK